VEGREGGREGGWEGREGWREGGWEGGERGWMGGRREGRKIGRRYMPAISVGLVRNQKKQTRYLKPIVED